MPHKFSSIFRIYYERMSAAGFRNSKRLVLKSSPLSRSINPTYHQQFVDQPFFSAAIRNLEQLIDDWILGDASDHIKCLVLGSKFDPKDSYALFKRHPLLCGLFQFKIYTYLQYISIDLANSMGTVLYMGHLYEACRQAGYLQHVWPDMELVMDFHTREQMFAGRTPQTPAESLKCMQLTLGVSLVNYSRSNRLNRVRVSKNNRKELSFNSPLMNLSHKQWVETKDMILTMSTVEDLLMSQKSASSQHNAAPLDEDQSRIQKQSAKDHKMTPLQLLDTLCNAISAEEHILRFDYISFHVRCLRFLRTLRTLLDHQLQDHFGPKYINDETQPFHVIYSIFQESAEFGKSQNQKPVLKSSTLKQASEVVEGFIKQEGSLDCDKLEKRCPGWSKNKSPSI